MERRKKASLPWLILLCLSVRFLCCAKAQMTLALPAGLILNIALAVTHRPQKSPRLIVYGLCVLIASGAACWDTYGVYTKNAGVSERQTVWQSVFYGALMVSDDKEAAMEELGIPREMAADIGKHAYYADEDYVYAPMSSEATEKFYSKVNTMTMVKYYLRHPVDLWRMLDHAAKESVTLNTSFMAYSDERYDENAGLYRFNLWRDLRPLTACRAFWQYLLLYGAAIAWCAVRMRRRETPTRDKLLMLLFLCVMMIGVLQYPLSVVGNGYADNNKQLYGFMLCHDLMTLTAVTVGIRQLVKRILYWERRLAGTEGGAAA